MKRRATAVWTGGPRAGEGTVSTASGVFRNALYTMGTSVMEVPCTSPCELLAAAEASSISMMICQELARRGVHVDQVMTESELDVAADGEGWKIPQIHLKIYAVSGDVAEEDFQQAVQFAKTNCPILRSLKAEVTADAFVQRLALAAAVR